MALALDNPPPVVLGEGHLAKRRRIGDVLKGGWRCVMLHPVRRVCRPASTFSPFGGERKSRDGAAGLVEVLDGASCNGHSAAHKTR